MDMINFWCIRGQFIYVIDILSKLLRYLKVIVWFVAYSLWV
jgi:hypothetical protein